MSRSRNDAEPGIVNTTQSLVVAPGCQPFSMLLEAGDIGMKRVWMLWCVLLLSRVAASADQQVTIYRDNWGVPHIDAQTPAAGAYGLGYAQAEDRLSDIHVSLRTGMGTMSEAFGERFVDHDYLMRLCRNTELARDTWDEMPAHLREFVEHFAAGVRAFQDEHPGDMPPHAVDFEPWMFRTIGRAMVLRWPLGTIKDDMKVGGGRPRPPMQSNQWVIAPERSAEGVPILLSDPHLTWEGLAVLYESRVHAGELQFCGYGLIGSPLLAIGHNRRVGWALTTGSPDDADVYEMKVRMKDGLEYEYDGEWRQATLREFTIPVAGGEPVVRPAAYTHLGPVMGPIDVENGRALVGAAPLLEKTQLLEQNYRMVTTANVREFFAAAGMGEFNGQNMMFADVHGDIGYVRCGATPIRPDGYDWSSPVPGHTSATAWQGLHPVTDLVHTFNPPQCYMQNCNISPENMMVNSPFTPDRYRDYIFNVSWDKTNPRSERALALLDPDESVTREEAIAYAMDVHDQYAEPWQAELKLAVDKVGQRHMRDETFSDAVTAILDWDGEFTIEATSTSLYKFWRLKCGNAIDLAPMAGGGNLAKAEQSQALDLLAETIAEMEMRYGRWDVPWGEIHKVGRAGQLFPVAGAEFRSGNKAANFSETLFDVKSEEDPDHPGRYIANSGSMAMILMLMHPDGIESMTCVAWGQSGHEDSPHFMDQGEKLYSPRKMKPTWWTREELLPNVESERVLQVDVGR